VEQEFLYIRLHRLFHDHFHHYKTIVALQYFFSVLLRDKLIQSISERIIMMNDEASKSHLTI